MCCLALIAGLIGPRVAFLLTWIFANDRVNAAFNGGWVVPLLGLLFLPWTTLVYTFAWSVVGGVTGIGWVFVGLAFLADFLSWTGGLRGRRTARR
ncbi:MAG: hypothetical protein EPO13_00840 [Actinomycetota bacterium]|nr:MAG: hypothetical protein EPO13_00840 [Actinomycetota bacterium]